MYVGFVFVVDVDVDDTKGVQKMMMLLLCASSDSTYLLQCVRELWNEIICKNANAAFPRSFIDEDRDNERDFITYLGTWDETRLAQEGLCTYGTYLLM